MARLFRADGTTQNVTPAHGASFELKELQALVGGYVQAVRLPSGRYLLMDEDAKAKQPVPPRNLNADLIALGLIARDDYIVGDVVVATVAEMGG